MTTPSPHLSLRAYFASHVPCAHAVVSYDKCCGHGGGNKPVVKSIDTASARRWWIAEVHGWPMTHRTPARMLESIRARLRRSDWDACRGRPRPAVSRPPSGYSRNCSRSLDFNILPVGPSGIASTNATSSDTCHFATCRSKYARISPREAAARPNSGAWRRCRRPWLRQDATWR